MTPAIVFTSQKITTPPLVNLINTGGSTTVWITSWENNITVQLQNLESQLISRETDGMKSNQSIVTII